MQHKIPIGVVVVRHIGRVGNRTVIYHFAQGVGDALVPAVARERALAANGIEDGTAGGAKTLEEAGRSGGASFVINGMED